MDSRLRRGLQEKERILAAHGLLFSAHLPGQCHATEATLPQCSTDCHAIEHLVSPVAGHGGRQVNRG